MDQEAHLSCIMERRSTRRYAHETIHEEEISK